VGEASAMMARENNTAIGRLEALLEDFSKPEERFDER